MAHLHVGSNIPGFLPENDTYCVDSAETAVTCALAEIRKLGEFTLDGCDEGWCRICNWCRRGRAIMARGQELTANADGFAATVGVGWSETFTVPCSPGHTVWVAVVDHDREVCPDNASLARTR